MSRKYLSFDEFNEYYNLSKKIYDSRGNIIYDEGDYVVKETGNLSGFLAELGYYQYLNHPCIMKVVHYSYRDNKYYFSTLKGENIDDAYASGKITIEQIASDLLSAINFIHKNGIGHFDIKEFNVLFLNGRATLIDFEISDKCDMYTVDIDNMSVNDYYCKANVGFSDKFRDPEFSFGYYYNTIRTDYYALGMTLYDIYNGKNTWSKRRDIFYPDIKDISNKILKDFIIKCVKQLKYRKEIYNHPIIVREYDGKINKREFGKIELFRNDSSFNYYLTSISWIIDIIKSLYLNVEIGFKIIHLFHYMLIEMINDYTSVEGKNEIQLVAISCIFLISNFKFRTVTAKYMSKTSGYKYSVEEIEDMSFKIIRQLNGILLFDTYCDIAHNYNQLLYLFNETLKGDYNTVEMPSIPLSSETSDVKDKNESFKSFISDWKKIYDIKYKDGVISVKNTVFLEQITGPIEFEITPMKLPPITYELYSEDVDKIIDDDKFDSYGVVIEGKDFIRKLDDEKREQYLYAMDNTLKRRQVLRFI